MSRGFPGAAITDSVRPALAPLGDGPVPSSQTRARELAGSRAWLLNTAECRRLKGRPERVARTANARPAAGDQPRRIDLSQRIRWSSARDRSRLWSDPVARCPPRRSPHIRIGERMPAACCHATNAPTHSGRTATAARPPIADRTKAGAGRPKRLCTSQAIIAPRKLMYGLPTGTNMLRLTTLDTNAVAWQQSRRSAARPALDGDHPQASRLHRSGDRDCGNC